MTFEGNAGDRVLIRFKDGTEMRRVLDADADFEIRAIHVKSDHIDGYWWVPKGELESVTVIREPKPDEYWELEWPSGVRANRFIYRFAGKLYAFDGIGNTDLLSDLTPVRRLYPQADEPEVIPRCDHEWDIDAGKCEKCGKSRTGCK